MTQTHMGLWSTPFQMVTWLSIVREIAVWAFHCQAVAERRGTVSDLQNWINEDKMEKAHPGTTHRKDLTFQLDRGKESSLVRTRSRICHGVFSSDYKWVISACIHYESTYSNKVLRYQEAATGQKIRTIFLNSGLKPSWRRIAHHGWNQEPYMLKQKLCSVSIKIRGNLCSERDRQWRYPQTLC